MATRRSGSIPSTPEPAQGTRPVNMFQHVPCSMKGRHRLKPVGLTAECGSIRHFQKDSQSPCQGLRSCGNLLTILTRSPDRVRLTQRLWTNFNEFLEGRDVLLAPALIGILALIRIAIWIHEFNGILTTARRRQGPVDGISGGGCFL